MPTETSYRHFTAGGTYTNYPGAVCRGDPPWGFIQDDPVPTYPATVTQLVYRQRTWSRTTGYEAKLLNGQVLPTQPYSDQRLLRRYPRISWYNSGACALDPEPKSRYAISSAEGTYGWFNSSGLTDSDPYAPGWLIADAKLKALNAAKDMSLNLPVFLNEGRQTVGLLRDNLSRFGNFLTYMYLGRWQRALLELGIKPHKGRKPQTREFANRVLEYKYGWVPLMSDCYGASKEFVELLGGKPPRGTIRANSYYTSNYTYQSGWVTPTLLKPTFSGTGVTGLYSAPAAMRAKYRNDRVTFYHQIAGLLVEAQMAQQPSNVGLNDPLLFLHESTKLSFVLDWWISVGDYLSAMTALRGLTVLRGFSSSVIRQEATGTVTDYNVPEHDRMLISNDMLESRRFYRRSAWSGSLPPFKHLVKPLDKLGLSEFISSAALLAQKFSR